MHSTSLNLPTHAVKLPTSGKSGAVGQPYTPPPPRHGPADETLCRQEKFKLKLFGDFNFITFLSYYFFGNF